MQTRLLMVNVVVLVFLSPQQILDFSSDSAMQGTVEAHTPAIQRTIEAVTPWLQVVAAGFTIVKHGSEFLDKKDKDDDSDDED
jgi:hypothetical protein